jgi:hypothetical protein
MATIPPGDLLFLALSVAAAPVGAAWLIRERMSAPKGQRTAPGSRGHGTTRETVDAEDPSATSRL